MAPTNRAFQPVAPTITPQMLPATFVVNSDGREACFCPSNKSRSSEARGSGGAPQPADSAADAEDTSWPFWKIVRHRTTGDVEIRRYWEVPCRQGPQCKTRKCQFQHYDSAFQWPVVAECHTKEAAVARANELLHSIPKHVPWPSLPTEAQRIWRSLYSIPKDVPMEGVATSLTMATLLSSPCRGVPHRKKSSR